MDDIIYFLISYSLDYIAFFFSPFNVPNESYFNVIAPAFVVWACVIGAWMFLIHKYTVHVVVISFVMVCLCLLLAIHQDLFLESVNRNMFVATIVIRWWEGVSVAACVGNFTSRVRWVGAILTIAYIMWLDSNEAFVGLSGFRLIGVIIYFVTCYFSVVGCYTLCRHICSKEMYQGRVYFPFLFLISISCIFLAQSTYPRDAGPEFLGVTFYYWAFPAGLFSVGFIKASVSILDKCFSSQEPGGISKN